MRVAAHAMRAGALALAMGIGAATGGMGVASAASSGFVKWFDDTKGYGFITPGDGGKDLFVHWSSIMMGGRKSLSEGLRVNYDVVMGAKGLQASNVSCNSCSFDPRSNRYVDTESAAVGRKAATSKAGPARAAR